MFLIDIGANSSFLTKQICVIAAHICETNIETEIEFGCDSNLDNVIEQKLRIFMFPEKLANI